MKKFITVILLFVGLLLTACENGEEEICKEDQTLIGDTCITLSANEVKVYNAIKNTQELDNYQFDLILSSDTERFDLEALFDSNVSKTTSEDGTLVTYYKKTDDLCFENEIYNGVSKERQLKCNENTGKYKLYSDFTYDMFALEDGVFKLKNEYLDTIENVLEETFLDITLNNLDIAVLDGYITNINYTMMYNDMLYQVQMEFSNFNEVSVEYIGEVK